jgi:hypothetical protein
MSSSRACPGVAIALMVAACAPADDPVAVPEADPIVFRDQVYPILLADCGFNGCHGSTERFFAVFGTARGRLDPATDLDAPPTPEELAVTFTRARSMLISPDGIDHAPLLRKPLAIAAGGARHAGTDPWGKAVFSSQQDPRFQILAAWALAATP